MARFSEQTRDLSRRVTRWVLTVTLVYSVVYVAAAIVFDNAASVPLGNAVADAVAPWEYVAADEVDDEIHARYEQYVGQVEADVIRMYMMTVVDDMSSGRSGALYASQEEALAAGGSPSDRLASMTAEEIYSLAEQAPDVLAAVAEDSQVWESADGEKIDGATHAAAAVALARSEDFAQAREQGLTLSSDVSFDEGLETTDWMREVILLAFDLRNAGVAGSVDDGIYRQTITWGNHADFVKERYEDFLDLRTYGGMGNYLLGVETNRYGIEYERYYADGHMEMRDLTLYTYISNLKEPLFVIGWLLGLLVVMRLGTRKALGYFDSLFMALADTASGLEGAADALPEELTPARRAMEDIERREDVARREAQLTERGKNELVAYLAHDTKTPLTSIIGYLSILSEEPDLPASQRQRYLNAALEKSYRLDGMIDEFFEIARFNITTLGIERAWCDPAMLCYQVADELFPAAEARDVTIEVQAEEGERAFVDARQLSRALSNVVKNAVSYADAGTAVVVELSMENEATDGAFDAGAAGVDEGAPDANGVFAAGVDASPGAAAQADAASDADTGTAPTPTSVRIMRIVVTNQGSEISAEHLERIFEKFYREDSARATERGGAGLGLAIAREIVQAYGGTISAESHEGTTVFTIEVPAE